MTSLSEVLTEAINHMMGGVYTMLPGVVESYDFKAQKAIVRPSISKVIRAGETITPPAIFEVPVIWPRTANAIIHLPLAPGDRVMVIFSCRSLELWLNNAAALSDPGDFRKFDLNDAVAVPGFYPFALQSPAENGQDLLIQHKLATVRLRQDSSIEVEQKASKAMIRIDPAGNVTVDTPVSASVRALSCAVECTAATVVTETADVKALAVTFAAVTVIANVTGVFQGTVLGVANLTVAGNTITAAPGVLDVFTPVLTLHGNLAVNGNINATGTITP